MIILSSSIYFPLHLSSASAISFEKCEQESQFLYTCNKFSLPIVHGDTFLLKLNENIK